MSGIRPPRPSLPPPHTWRQILGFLAVCVALVALAVIFGGPQ